MKNPLPSNSSGTTTHRINEPAKSKVAKISKPTDQIILKRDEAISDLVAKVELFNVIYKTDLTKALANLPKPLRARQELHFLQQWQGLVTLMIETLRDRQALVEDLTKGGRPKNHKGHDQVIAFILEYKNKNGRHPSAAYVHSTLTRRNRNMDKKNLPSQSTIRDILKNIKAIYGKKPPEI